MSVDAKEKKPRKIFQEDIESVPKGGKQAGRRGRPKKSVEEKLKAVIPTVEVYAMDMLHIPKSRNEIFKKNSQFVQVNVPSVNGIAEYLDKVSEEFEYVDTAMNLNGSCWIILKRIT